MGKAYTLSDIKSFLLGFLLYFIAVIVADIYKGSGIVNIYYVLAVLWCIPSIPRCLKKHIAPIELLAYFLLIVIVEYMNRQNAIYYYEGLLQIGCAIILSNYLITIRRVKYFSIGLAVSIALGCIWFCLFATNSELNFGDSELRHSLPFFYISSAGLMTSLGYFLALANLTDKRIVSWIIVALLCFATCLYTLSKNALLSMVVITFIYLTLIKVIRMNRRTITIFVIMAIIFFLFGDVLTPILSLFSEAIDTSNSDEMINISGRGGIWMFAVENISQKPWFGHGYYTASELLMEKINENVSQAHNGILHVLLSTGWLGFALLTTYIIRCFMSVKKHMLDIIANTQMRWLLCMLLYFMIRSITEASFAQCGSFDVFWFLLLTHALMNIVNPNLEVNK